MRDRSGNGGLRASRVVAASGLAITTIATAACGSSSSSAPSSDGSPSVSIVSPGDRTTWSGNVLTLQLRSSGVKIVAADGSAAPGRGHFHIFIDKQPPASGAPIPKGPGIIHTPDTTVVVPGLTAGYHTIAVVIGDGAHRRMGSSEAETSVLMSGPSVTATAASTVPAGDPVQIQLKASGVDIVKANGDGSGNTGHFHLFVDRLAVKPGEVIPKDPDIIHTAASKVDVPGLAPGVHTIWVVLGDGNHRAFDPAVEARVVVTVEPAPVASPPV